jgi:hypothetical protein
MESLSEAGSRAVESDTALRKQPIVCREQSDRYTGQGRDELASGIRLPTVAPQQGYE